MSEVTFEIKKYFGTIRKQPTGWSRELNLVSWNGGVPKYDIREWDKTHTMMSRGITLSEEEFIMLLRIARDIKF